MMKDAIDKMVGMTPSQQLSERLDAIFSACQQDGFSIAHADSLINGLRALRLRLPESDWRQLIELASGHPVHACLRQCPVVDHSVRRPRGYPGDAELIDYLYDGIRDDYALPPTVSVDGKAIFDWIVRLPSSESLRRRRDYMTREIARQVVRQTRANVLSVAAGHAREWLTVKTLLESDQAHLTALDQDERSLDEIRETFGADSVRTVSDSIVNLLSGTSLAESFDLIYSMGLYDYLTDGVAERLTEFLYSRLEPGGRLLIANYTPDMESAAFMEMFMRWDLIYRDEREMRQLARRVPLADPSLLAVKELAGGMIIVLELTKPR